MSKRQPSKKIKSKVIINPNILKAIGTKKDTQNIEKSIDIPTIASLDPPSAFPITHDVSTQGISTNQLAIFDNKKKANKRKCVSSEPVIFS